MLVQSGLSETIYVDNTLTQNCTSGNYSISNRNGNGSDGNAYKTIKEAIQVMKAGDVVLIRGGVYNEIQIDIGGKTNGSESNKYTIKSFPDEWAVVDGKHGGSGSQRSVFYGTGSPMQYWVFENMEITGGGQINNPPDAGSGIFLFNAKNCEFRNLYIHDNYSSTVNVGAAGGILLGDDVSAPSNNLIEFCYFKCNGGVNTNHNSANAHIAIFSDYKYDNTVDPAKSQHNNIVRYNLFDGSCSSGYTDVGVMQKGFQRLTGYTQGETGSSSDNSPNGSSYRSYGDEYHHNIFRNLRMGVRLDQDYIQFHHNIIFLDGGSWSAEETAAIESRDSYTSRRGPYYACIYNNTVYADDKRAIDLHMIWDDWSCNQDGINSNISKAYVVNNIIDTGNSGYDWRALSFDSNGQSGCSAPQPTNPADVISSRNYFYRCSGTSFVYIENRAYSKSEIEATASADRIYLGAFNQSNLLYKGSSGVDQYKVFGTHSVGDGFTISNAGINESHPYLTGVQIPGYIGATDPNNDQWVDMVINLENLSDNNGGEVDTDPPAKPFNIKITK